MALQHLRVQYQYNQSHCACTKQYNLFILPAKSLNSTYSTSVSSSAMWGCNRVSNSCCHSMEPTPKCEVTENQCSVKFTRHGCVQMQRVVFILCVGAQLAH